MTEFTATPTATVPARAAVVAAEAEYSANTCEVGLCPGFLEWGDYDDIDSDAQTIYAYSLMSGIENDGDYFEVGDTINIWSIDTKANKNTNTAAFELAGAGSLAVTLGAAALAALAMM